MRKKVQGDSTPLYDPVAALEDRTQILAFLCYSLGIDPNSNYTIDDLVLAAGEMYQKPPVEGAPEDLGIETYEPVYLFMRKYRVSLLRSCRRVWRAKTLDQARIPND